MRRLFSGVIGIVAPFLMMLGGAAFIIFGVIGIKEADTFVPVKAVIESIDVTPGIGDDPDEYKVIVKYTVDGTAYHSDLGTLSNGDHEGKEIDVLYDPEDLGRVIRPGKAGPIIAIVFGAVVILGGIGTLIGRIVRGR